MALLRDRASGIMDFIGRMGADLVTPPQASPVMPTSTSPMQMAMNRPQVQFSQPSANAMVTSDPRGTFMAMASPTPQIRQEMIGAGVTGPRMNPPQVVPARPEGLEPNRLMGPRGPVGSGVSMTGPQLEQARMAARVVEEVQKTPEIQNDPTFMDGVRSYFGDRENMVRLALAFNSMRLNPDAGLASVLGDELKDIRTQTRAQSTRNATANWLRSQNREDLANLVEQGMIDGKQATELFMGQTGRVVTSAELKQQYPDIKIEDGLYNIKADGTMNKVGGGGVSVQVDSGGAPGLGRLSTDFTYARNPETNEILYRDGLPVAVPVPGSPAARELEQQEQKTVGRQEQTARAGATVIQDLQRALDLVPELGAISSGEGVVGGVSRTALVKIPGTVENRITQFTESALSNVGLDTLQQMRENSPTGGALGQVPIQQQQRLEQVLGSLQINQPPEVLSANIKRVMNIYTDIIYGTARERAEAVQAGKMTQDESNQIDSFYYDLPFDERGRIVDTPRVIEYDSQGRRLN